MSVSSCLPCRRECPSPETGGSARSGGPSRRPSPSSWGWLGEPPRSRWEWCCPRGRRWLAGPGPRSWERLADNKLVRATMICPTYSQSRALSSCSRRAGLRSWRCTCRRPCPSWRPSTASAPTPSPPPLEVRRRSLSFSTSPSEDSALYANDLARSDHWNTSWWPHPASHSSRRSDICILIWSCSQLFLSRFHSRQDCWENILSWIEKLRYVCWQCGKMCSHLNGKKLQHADNQGDCLFTPILI